MLTLRYDKSTLYTYLSKIQRTCFYIGGGGIMLTNGTLKPTQALFLPVYHVHLSSDEGTISV